MILRNPAPDVNFLTPATLSRRFGLSAHEVWQVLLRSELRTRLRRGHQVVDVRTFVAAWLTTAPSFRPEGGRP